MVKDVVRVILALDPLEERIQSLVSVIELRPEGIREHIGIRVVDVTALVLLIVVRGSLVGGAGVEVGVEDAHPLQLRLVLGVLLPVALELGIEDGGALRDGGGRRTRAG